MISIGSDAWQAVLERIGDAAPTGRGGNAAAHARALRAGAMTLRRVHINGGEGLYFDHDEAGPMALEDRAAVLGVERFVLDDGWFRRHDDDTAAEAGAQSGRPLLQSDALRYQPAAQLGPGLRRGGMTLKVDRS